MFALWCHVTPIYPGRNTRLARKLQNAVCRAATIAAYNHDLAIADAHPEGIGLGNEFLKGNLITRQTLELLVVQHVELVYFYLALTLASRFASDGFHVGGKHVQGLGDNGSIVFLSRVGDMATRVPHHILGRHGGRQTKDGMKKEVSDFHEYEYVMMGFSRTFCHPRPQQAMRSG